jgi:hypothetical protein
VHSFTLRVQRTAPWSQKRDTPTSKQLYLRARPIRTTHGIAEPPLAQEKGRHTPRLDVTPLCTTAKISWRGPIRVTSDALGTFGDVACSPPITEVRATPLSDVRCDARRFGGAAISSTRHDKVSLRLIAYRIVRASRCTNCWRRRSTAKFRGTQVTSSRRHCSAGASAACSAESLPITSAASAR